MAKSSTRRVTIYINGKEVEASVEQIRAEMNCKLTLYEERVRSVFLYPDFVLAIPVHGFA
jgi:hypothetical protein